VPGIYPDLPLGLPESGEEIARIQSARKIVAVENARRSPFWRQRLGHIDITRLDDPEEWRKIPILEKDDLRALDAAAFYEDFCHFRRQDVCEYWRSGGSTGKPLFYPRTNDDIRYAMVGFTRTFQCTGTPAGESAHISFPLGIHPAGHMWARAAQIIGIGVVWAGSGTALPSAAQLDLCRMLKPSIWMGMSSYGLHLANLAEAEGIDLAASTVGRILCTAEPVSDAKRAKMERVWGARLYDCFGMTECTMMGAEGAEADGFHIWTDLAFIEVLDPETHKPVAPGRPGMLVVTPLFTNNATPFLRWSSGDIVIEVADHRASGPFSVFPRLRHAHRTSGFFKIRGVNVNHQELEDFMFEIDAVNDFKAEAVALESGLDALRLAVEVRRGAVAADVAADVARRVKAVFEISPEVEVLPIGTLAREFESSVKAPRFADRRG
jgi:phenylacetate-CoA ligase